jgi:hypothetical protein
MLELDAEARQGDSGGPIFNQSGELAGVLFGAGQGTTMGSFAPRVRCFLAAVAPDIDQANSQTQIAAANRPAPVVNLPSVANCDGIGGGYPSAPWSPSSPWLAKKNGTPKNGMNGAQLASNRGLNQSAEEDSVTWNDVNRAGWFESGKSILAVIGLAAIALRMVKLVR